MKNSIYVLAAIVIVLSISGCAGTAQRGAMIRAYSGLHDKEYDFALKRLYDAERYLVPEPALQAEISYLKGVCFQGLTKIPEAKAMYTFVMDTFPNSQYAYMAREKLYSMNTDNLLEHDLFSSLDRKQRRQNKPANEENNRATNVDGADAEQGYDIKAGIITKTNGDGYAVVEETTEIPYILKSEDPEFRFGFVAGKDVLKATACYYTANMPTPRTVTSSVKGVLSEPNKQIESRERVEVKSETFICRDGFSAAIRLDEGDRLGLYQIKIFADDDLVKVIDLNVVKKQ